MAKKKAPRHPRRGTAPTQMRLSDADLAALDAIAAREGLTYGGVPSRAEAVRWLIRADRERGGKAREKN